MTTPFQEALLALDVCVDALHAADTDEAREALEQVAHLGFDARPTTERRARPAPHAPRAPHAARVRGKWEQGRLF